MKVLGAILAAGVAFAATMFFIYGGFSRFRTAAPRNTTQTSDHAALPPRPAETDPARLLYRAVEFRDADETIKILNEHPELASKKLNSVYPLSQACEWGDLSVVKAFVEHGANVNTKDGNNQSVLWQAVFNRHDDVVKYLLEKGADAKALQDQGETLLWAAKSKAMAQLLINAGVDPKYKTNENDTALHKACRNCLADVVGVLLDNGLDVEAKGKFNMRPIHSAASSISGDARPVLKLLLEHGADVNSRGFEGQTALHECVMFNRLDNAALLLSRGADPNVLNDKKQTALDLFDVATKVNRVKLYNLLVRHEARGANGEAGTLIPEVKE